MAQVRKARKAAPEAETKIIAQTVALKSKIEHQKDGKATDAQTAELKQLRSQLGTLKFKRMGTARITKAVKAIHALGNLAGPAYTKTEAQIEFTIKQLTDAVANVKAKLGGQKTATTSVEMPD